MLILVLRDVEKMQQHRDEKKRAFQKEDERGMRPYFEKGKLINSG